MGSSSGTDDVPKSYRDILAREIEVGLQELRRPSTGLALSGLSAGLDIGFGPLLMAVMLTLMTGSLPEPVTELLMSVMYSVGFLFVVLGRSELFTEHTTLAVLPVLDDRASLPELARLWGLVYGANILGGAIFASLAVVVAPALGIASTDAFAKLATPLVAHDPLVILAAAVFAGWLMGLLSWLVAAAQDTTGRIIVIGLIAGSIGLAHLPHSIAGNVEVLLGLFSGAGISALAYLEFLAATTVGNAIGGVVFVAILKYGHVIRSDEGADAVEAD